MPCTPAVNHHAPAFTENKRYRAEQRALAHMVNRKRRSVYQTCAISNQN
jgi:hypothetical protein